MDQITFALKNLAKFGEGFIPSRIGGSGDFEISRYDGIEIAKDLILIARRADAVVQAYGRYLLAQGVIRQDDLKLFTNQLENAIEGNALYAIESGVDQRVSEFA